MHFSKTYAELLLALPPELTQSAVQYRQLKKIINQIVAELSSLGLSPDVLQAVIDHPPVQDGKGKRKEDGTSAVSGPRVVYELATAQDGLQPRLHLYLHPEDASQTPPSQPTITIPLSASSRVFRLSGVTTDGELASSSDALLRNPPTLQELIIPLRSDTAFYRTLNDALESLSVHLAAKRADFEASLRALSHDISSASRPSSSSSSFRPYSAFSDDAANITLSSHSLSPSSKSDLETWREIFQLYVEADIFQGHQERFRGERSVEDAEARLVKFQAGIQERLSAGRVKLRLKQSRAALKTFMELNTFILDLRKFQYVTSEATRKILKKHAKRTALPLAPDLTSPFAVAADSTQRSLILAHPAQQESLTLSLLLVQALTETLLPIIPHIDDYACVICTSLAFKPIRLRCSHLFCVRCLVKLQKRGEGHCPMCRASTVLEADRSNVDWALLNFMKDWFPLEARKKLHQNEREAAEEEMKELGLNTNGCTTM